MEAKVEAVCNRFAIGWKAVGNCFYDTRRNFVTRPVDTHSAT